MKPKGRKGTSVNLSISDDLQIKGYKMAKEDCRKGLTNLVEYLIDKEWNLRHPK